ncbi:MAG: DNA polymerase III subunit alpha [Anaerolineales bacterium]|nr:DNA polymerase III subunit alpha [Chloroflexota bacterium]MBL6981443.1 DNA polymerase III subunit alpha [Anaerolineales bacterium]
MKFVHLHTHSYYSFLEGVPSPQDLVNAAVEHGMSALALTDHHGLTGALEFYEACLDAGIKPILGLEVAVQHTLGLGNLVFLAKDLQGWSSLCRLSSAAQSAPDRDPEQGISFEVLAENSSGLICLTGGVSGLVRRLAVSGQREAALDFLFELQAAFQGNLYVELQPNESFREMTSLATQANLSIVATNNVHYINADDAQLQRTLSAMRLNCRLSELPSDAPAPSGSHFASGDEMSARFVEFPEAISNTLAVAESCNLELPLGVPHYPKIPLPEGKTALDVLSERADVGAKQQYGEITQTIRQRLKHELKVIAERGYAPLFLIMAEIMDFAREAGVPTSSRGSAASSLVAHCLGITTPDPLALNLYFERFLNPSRSSPPDIDTDLCSKRRAIVIQHVYDKYGHERVAMVATINRFRRRSALREAAKAHGLSEKFIKEMTADLPYRGWSPRARARVSGDDPFGELVQRYPSYRAVFKDAAAILNFPRHLSIHPGGIVIAPGPLNDLVPTHLASKGIVITQFDLDTIEKFGLVKIDLLGTRGLSVLGDVAERLRDWTATEYPSSLHVLDAIPEDDPDTAAMVRDAQTIGCFAIESPGMRATLKEIDAHSPEDIMIALALYRPGPLTGGLKDAFIQRHLGLQDVTC